MNRKYETETGQEQINQQVHFISSEKTSGSDSDGVIFDAFRERTLDRLDKENREIKEKIDKIERKIEGLEKESVREETCKVLRTTNTLIIIMMISFIICIIGIAVYYTFELSESKWLDFIFSGIGIVFFIATIFEKSYLNHRIKKLEDKHE